MSHKKEEINYSTVCTAKTRKEMRRQLAILLRRVGKEFGGTLKERRPRQLSNIGYIAGYYDSKVRQRVYRWLSTTHPILGNV